MSADSVVFVTFQGSDGEGATVILNGATVYHEDDEKNYSQAFTAKMVAERLGKALGILVKTLHIPERDLPEDWNFDDVEKAALTRAAEKGRT